MRGTEIDRGEERRESENEFFPTIRRAIVIDRYTCFLQGYDSFEYDRASITLPVVE